MILKKGKQGFTLIEIAIVLVIIGLVVGGVLVGRDLIRAAEMRSQISQIEKYNQAVNTFRGKYGGLPGDLDSASAATFGFIARGSTYQGDGNGLIESAGGCALKGICQGNGETVVFWVDLSKAGMIEDNFNTANETTLPSSNVTGTKLALYFPSAKIGANNYVYAYSTGGLNYYGLSAANTIFSSFGVLNSSPALTVLQAYSIDSKVDDGLPQSGSVLSLYLNSASIQWTAPGFVYYPPTYTTATAASSSTCYDNGNVGGGVQQYSILQNGGKGVNCALSFKFQ